MTQAIGCNLPWVRFKNESLETCQNEADFRAYFNATRALQREITNILPGCNQNTWTVTHFFEERDWKHPDKESEIFFLGQDLRVTMEEENYQYGLSDFVGDFGGYLGLFLGGSIIGIFEFIEDFMKKIRQRRITNQID